MTRQRAGYSILEMVMAIGLSALLVAVMTSTIVLSGKTLELHGSSAARSMRASSLLATIQADLQLGLEFIEVQQDSIEFTVPDRDNDGLPETISYHWDQAGTLALLKSVKLSTGNTGTTTLAANVAWFDLSATIEARGTAPAEVEKISDSVLLHANGDAPEGDGSGVLMIVSDSLAPTSDESARKTQLESWGFTVTEVSYDDTAPDLSAYDLIYIVHAPAVGDWTAALQETTVGIVNEVPTIAEELGFGKLSDETKSRSRIQTRLLTHYLAEASTEGAEKLFEMASSTNRLTGDSGNRSSDLQVMSWLDDEPCVCWLEPGAEPFYKGAAQILGTSTSYSIELGQADTSRRNFVFPVQVTSRGIITKFSALIDHEPGGMMRFGVYDDAGDQPGSLLFQSDPLAFSTGLDDQWVDASAAGMALTPGQYWISVAISDGITLHRGPGTGVVLESAEASVDTGISNLFTTERLRSWDLSAYAEFVETPLVNNRRVQFPFFEDSFDNLSSYGLELLRRGLWWTGDSSPQDTSLEYALDGQADVDYFFKPDQIPVDATAWKPERIFVSIRRNPGNANARLKFKLAQADVNELPALTLQESDWVYLSKWSTDENFWFEIPFHRADWVPTGDGIVLTLQGASTTSWDAAVRFDSSSGGVPFEETEAEPETGEVSEFPITTTLQTTSPFQLVRFRRYGVQGLEQSDASSFDADSNPHSSSQFQTEPQAQAEQQPQTEVEAEADPDPEPTTNEFAENLDGPIRIYVRGRYLLEVN